MFGNEKVQNSYQDSAAKFCEGNVMLPTIMCGFFFIEFF